MLRGVLPKLTYWCLQRPEEGVRSLGTGVSGLGATLWVLEIEPESSGGVVRALNC